MFRCLSQIHFVLSIAIDCDEHLSKMCVWNHRSYRRGPYWAPSTANKHGRSRRTNNAAIHEHNMIRLLNRAAHDDGRRHRSTTVDSVQVDTYDARPHIAGDFDCVPLAMSPGPTVCLYQDAEDEFISKIIRSSGLWEPRILNDTFKKILIDDVELGVIDIGANIGVYSLVSAAMGHDVVAVEPFEGHLRRFHKAINLGRLYVSAWVFWRHAF